MVSCTKPPESGATAGKPCQLLARTTAWSSTHNTRVDAQSNQIRSLPFNTHHSEQQQAEKRERVWRKRRARNSSTLAFLVSRFQSLAPFSLFLSHFCPTNPVDGKKKTKQVNVPYRKYHPQPHTLMWEYRCVITRDSNDYYQSNKWKNRAFCKWESLVGRQIKS